MCVSFTPDANKVDVNSSRKSSSGVKWTACETVEQPSGKQSDNIIRVEVAVVTRVRRRLFGSALSDAPVSSSSLERGMNVCCVEKYKADW